MLNEGVFLEHFNNGSRRLRDFFRNDLKSFHFVIRQYDMMLVHIPDYLKKEGCTINYSASTMQRALNSDISRLTMKQLGSLLASCISDKHIKELGNSKSLMYGTNLYLLFEAVRHLFKIT